MSAKNSALIYIPDISGYTSFVNDTEIDHSRHILTELLEIIINSDQLGLTVSEVEGDAVLSHRMGDPPTIDELIDQCRNTFINFHNHVRRYDSERICRCGACETAVKLTLKFVIHYGEVELLKVKEHENLHGFDVILAHRLLKNSIPENEYILFSHKFNPEHFTELKKTQSLLNLESASTEYENIGRVLYNYVPLNPLHEFVNEPDPITIPGLGPNKVSLQTSIRASIGDIYEKFTNFDKRLEWNEEIREIILRNEKINKAGAMHTCLVGPNELEIESLGRMENDDRIIYGERLDRFKGLKDIITIYTFEKDEEKTNVKVDVDFKASSFIARLFQKLIRKMLITQTEKGLKKLKLISEK